MVRPVQLDTDSPALLAADSVDNQAGGVQPEVRAGVVAAGSHLDQAAVLAENPEALVLAAAPEEEALEVRVALGAADILPGPAALLVDNPEEVPVAVPVEALLADSPAEPPPVEELAVEPVVDLPAVRLAPQLPLASACPRLLCRSYHRCPDTFDCRSDIASFVSLSFVGLTLSGDFSGNAGPNRIDKGFASDRPIAAATLDG